MGESVQLHGVGALEIMQQSFKDRNKGAYRVETCVS